MMRLPAQYAKLTTIQRSQVRKQYIRQQNGLCWHCHAPIDEDPPMPIMALNINPRLFPHSFFQWPIHLHHDHNTGLTIGAVHNHCNAVLWQYYGE